ncbi:MAG: YhdH/YhfP family quinone oxidoreductase [Bacteroidota bacterium]|jgi:putative YhdH/YhfP family quinone oxidoreductase
MAQEFQAFVVEEQSDGTFIRNVQTRTTDDLPKGDVLIKVHYSSLNYKDALSANGHKGITRKYPHTPGVDASGIVEHSLTPLFKEGDEVLVTGYDLGMNTAGGFAQYIRVPAEWIVKIPENLTLRKSMFYGTAGFTAGIAISRLQHNGISPEKGKILVTGATGGVGSLAVAMLAKSGYYVVASTGKQEQKEFLMRLGAKEIIGREEVNDKSGKPMLQKRWQGAIDNVGGNTLATIIKSLNTGGVVAVIGLVGSDKLCTTVYPYILRGVSAVGIDSAERPMDERLNIWNRISNEWFLQDTEFYTKECNLYTLNQELDLILEGKQTGKVILKLQK